MSKFPKFDTYDYLRQKALKAVNTNIGLGSLGALGGKSQKKEQAKDQASLWKVPYICKSQQPTLGGLGTLGGKVIDFKKYTARLSPLQRELYKERAATKELDGGLSQKHSEREALCEIIELNEYRT